MLALSLENTLLNPSLLFSKCYEVEFSQGQDPSRNCIRSLRLIVPKLIVSKSRSRLVRQHTLDSR